MNTWQWLPIALPGVFLIAYYVYTGSPQDLDIEDLLELLSQVPSDDHGARIQKVYEWRFERYKLFVQAAFVALLGVIGVLFASYIKGDFTNQDSPLYSGSSGFSRKTILIVLVNFAIPSVPFFFSYRRMRLAEHQFLTTLTSLLPSLEEPPEEGPATDS